MTLSYRPNPSLPMKLKSLTPINYGPFSTQETITFEPSVTVLTGANDTGKTSVLDLIRHICKIEGGSARADEFNSTNAHYIEDANTTDEFGARATFVATDVEEQPELTYKFYLRSARYEVDPLSPSSDVVGTAVKSGVALLPPKAILLDSLGGIRTVIDMTALTPLEYSLFRHV